MVAQGLQRVCPEVIADATLKEKGRIRIRGFRWRFHAVRRKSNVTEVHGAHVGYTAHELWRKLGQLAAGNRRYHHCLSESHIGQLCLRVLRFVQAAQVEQLLQLLLVLLRCLLVMMLDLLMMGERGQLHVLDVLLQHEHVVRVFLAGHVYPEIARDVGLIIAHVAAKRGLRLALIATLGGQMRAVILLVVGAPRRHWRVLRRGGVAGAGATPAALLQLLHVVQMLVALHVYTEIALGRGRVVAHLASVRFIAAGVSLPAG